MPSAHRDDIDGLRAIAVLAVIAFHVRAGMLPGGFLGVDVFFVISGYLITRNILGELAAGRFTLTEFYRRRVKRIAPAMLLVTGSSLIAAQCLMLPGDAEAVAKSAVWSLASAANVHFWLDLNRDYFAASSAEVPLLHLWSLGVEEQFYLLWPLLLLALHRPARRLPRLMCAAMLAALLSFAAAQWIVGISGPFAYYMLPTRAGELLLGALVAMMSLAGWLDRPARGSLRLAGPAGAALLGISLMLVDEHAQFPGWLAVPPTAGAALLIVAGEGGPTWVSRMLTLPALVWVGRISYSAYLWHWPLLAFYRYGFGDPAWPASALIVSATLALAWLSYEFVEQPLRHSRRGAWAVWLRQLLMPGALIGAFALLMVYGERHGLDLFTRKYRQALAALRQEVRPVYALPGICQRQRLEAVDLRDLQCVLGPGQGEAGIILWGDSNATHFVPMLTQIATAAGWRMRNVAVGACPPLLGDPQPFVTGDRLADCRHSLQQAWPEVRRHRVLVIAASWTTYQQRSSKFMEELQRSLRELAGAGHTLILLGKVPVIAGYDPRCRQKALHMPGLECLPPSNPMPKDVRDFNNALRDFAERTPGIRYFDVTPALCPLDRCAAVDASGLILYNDSHHLSIAGSAQLGRQLTARGKVPSEFQDLPIQ